MKKILTLISVFVILSTDLTGQSKKDTLFFTNGTQVIGILKKIKVGVVTFDPDWANDITVQLKRINTINAGREIYRVESTRKEVYFGVLTQDSIPHSVRIINGVMQKSLGMEDIVNLYPYSDRFIQRFSGNFGLGYNYTRSSSFGRLNFDGTLTYLSKKQEVTTAISTIYSVTDSNMTRDREDVSVKANHYFSPTSFVTAFLAYQRNLELGIQRRYQEGFGIGNKFITRKVAYAWARGGLAFNQEKSTEGASTPTLAEFYTQIQFNFFKFTKPEVKFDIKQSIYAGITEKGRFRSDGEANLSWEIVSHLKMNFQVYNNYDSKPPVVSSSNFDYGLVFGLSYYFY
ncbi:MAG TPA: DUF481 domain-containing protein [Chitinophagaceae bacterium]|nr:DUF481 domain-containing protein [Chitinophagaceae bacterium]